MSDRLSREWLPAAPLIAARPPFESGYHGWPMGGIGREEKRLARAFCRMQNTGRVTVGMADDICIHLLGRHPAEIYGSLWFE